MDPLAYLHVTLVISMGRFALDVEYDILICTFLLIQVTIS